MAIFKTKEDIESEIEEKKNQIAELEEQEENDELDEIIDEEGEIEISGLSYQRSWVLKEIDKIAYRQMLLDFNDDKINELSNEISELESDLKEFKE